MFDDDTSCRGWHPDDTIDVMILMDRHGIEKPLGAKWPPDNLLDHFVLSLHNRLQVLENQATLVVDTKELPTEDDYPSQIHGVVTNVPSVARWTRSWGGNLVTVEERVDSLRLTGRQVRTFDRAQLEDALAFTSDELDALPDDPPDVGVTATELRRLEVVLTQADHAIYEAPLDALDRALLQAAVDTLRAQLASPEPDRHIIGRTLRRFTSVGGGVLIGVLGNYATELLRHFHVPWP